jgi:hypothetical protein
MRGSEPVTVFRYRGRNLSAGDIELIVQTINANYSRGRSHIARLLCAQWDWRQANGKYKEYAGRDLLLRLEEAGHIELPPRLRPKNNLKVADYTQIPLFIQRPLDGRVDAYPTPKLRPAEGPERYLWDYLVHHYHYLGHPKLVGEHLKQLVFIDDQVVGCIGWASAAWKVGARDAHIGWSTAQRRAHLSSVINNVRFLLLPWVQIEHLASKVLACSLRELDAVWLARFGHAPVLAETFVDPRRFAGTCYQAANWQWVGQTRGHAKRGNRYHAHEQSKDVWLYPLHRRWRAYLLREEALAS